MPRWMLPLAVVKDRIRAAVLDRKMSILGEEKAQAILDEKEQIIRKSGLLEYYATDENFANVGGLSVLKDWLTKHIQQTDMKYGPFFQSKGVS